MTTTKDPFLRAAELALHRELSALVAVEIVHCSAKIPFLSGLKIQPETFKFQYDASLGEYYYFFIGYHGFAIVDKNFIGTPLGSEEHDGFSIFVDYNDIKEILVSNAALNANKFAMMISSQQRNDKIPSIIFFESKSRNVLLDKLNVAFAGSKMFQTLSYSILPTRIIDAVVEPKFTEDWICKKNESSTQLSDFDDEGNRIFVLNNVSFIAPSEFCSVTQDLQNSNVGLYTMFDTTRKNIQFDHPFFTIHFLKPQSLMFESDSPLTVLNRTLARITHGKDYRVATPAQKYERKSRKNTVFDDLCEWECVEKHVRVLGSNSENQETSDEMKLLSKSTSLPASLVLQDTLSILELQDRFREITVMVARRRFIPPKLNTYQDIIVCHRGDQRSWILASNEFDDIPSLYGIPKALFGARDIIDSVSPLTEITRIDHIKKIARAQAYALAFPYKAYTWVQTKYGITPPYSQARKCCASILSLFIDHGFSVPSDTLTDEERHYVGSHPIRHIRELENCMPSMEPMRLHDAYVRAWKRRCWEYLFHIIQNKVFFKYLSVEVLVDMYSSFGEKSNTGKRIIGQILDSLVYLRLVRTDFKWRPLAQLLRSEDLMLNKDLTFNVRAMTKMLESGYILTILRGVDESLYDYAQVLVRLLFWQPTAVATLSDAQIEDFRRAICCILYKLTPDTTKILTSEPGEINEVDYISSMDPLVFIDHVLPDLSAILFNCDEESRYWPIKSLCKLTRDPNSFLVAKVTALLVKRKALYQIVETMKTQNDRLCMAVCELANNLASYEEAREQLVSMGIIDSALKILQWQPIEQPEFQKRNFNPQPFRSIELLINAVSILGTLSKDEVTRVKILDASSNPSRARKVFTILHGLIHSSNTKLITGSEAVGTPILTRLRVLTLTLFYELSFYFSKNKLLIGYHILPLLQEMLQSTTSRDLIHISLDLLSSLVLEPDVVNMLRGEKKVKIYPGLHNIMTSEQVYTTHIIKDFQTTLTSCGEISEFKSMVSKIVERVYRAVETVL